MTSLTEQVENTDFHDASLERCLHEKNSLQMDFQNILFDIEQEEYYSATVILSGVREIRRFDEPVAQLTMEGEGEVLQFHKGKGRALLLLEWHTYQPNTTTFVQYEIDYATASVTVEKQDGLSV
jgi:hypothetical protein